MNLFQINNLTKTYGDKIIFDNIALNINSEDKIGVIGVNGAGKSTLLRIIGGLDTGDTQDIMKSSSLTIEYLGQAMELDSDLTVLEQVFKSDSKIVRLVGQYEGVVEKLNKNPDDKDLQDKMLKLSSEMDIMDAWGLESEAKKILTKLNISDFDKKIGDLSGGMKKRVALAGVLIRPSDLLILDEPTNHIDNATVEFLENIIKTTKAAVIMVTHDRYFLDRAMNTIAELKDGKIYKYSGNYTKYLEIKAQREFDENIIEEKKKKLYKSELEWIRKGVEARRTKQKARKERFFQLEEEIENKGESALNINIAQERLGNKIIDAQGISKAYGGRSLFGDFTYTLQRSDRIGIVGENGAGKTTLLNILAGRLEPDEGRVEIGDTVKICYYTQENEDAPEDLRVIDYIKKEAEYVSTAEGKKITASQMLENFLFSPKAQQTQIGRISGGERRRLYLLKLLMHSANVLFLDEPTNDLDIETLSILEDYINHFDGPVITVSHDRYFLDKICNKIFLVEGGKIQYFMGNYEDFRDQYKEVLEDRSKAGIFQNSKPDPGFKKEENSREAESAKPKKLSYNQQRELEALPGEIERLEKDLEATIKEISETLTDFAKLQTLMDKKESAELELLEKMEKQEYYDNL